MTLKISFTAAPKTKAAAAILPVYAGGKLSDAGRRLDREHGGAAAACLAADKSFTGKAGTFLTLALSGKGAYSRIILAGMGAPEKLGVETCETIGGKLYAALDGIDKAHLRLDDGKTGKTTSDAAVLAAALATGLRLRAYKFDKYRARDKAEKDTTLTALEIVTPAHSRAAALYAQADAMVQGVFLARDLVNEPPNRLYPESFAARIKSELAPLGVKVEIFDEKMMQKLGFHAALAVGMGSARPPRVVVMRWPGRPAAGKAPGAAPKGKAKTPLAFIGKGVTFDTGGINLKPSDGLGDMKLDMGGAAAVVGLMKTLALRKSKADVVGIVGLAENMPSHNAYRPSDIIESLAGKTIEIMNTDAEGRLVLADCLTYIQRTYDPRLVIDLATLTGAMMVALGAEYCGTFVNDNTLWTQLEAASKASGEKLWRMPLDEVFKKDVVGKMADLQNLGGMGRYAGACTAAGFLEHFIDPARPWAHLDIAGTAWIKTDRPTCPKPATGFGVRVLDRLVADHYE